MSQTTPRIREIAKVLVLSGLQGSASPEAKSSEAKSPDAPDPYQKLNGVLAPLMGTEGFQAFLSHALVLAKEEATCLTRVTVQKDGVIEGLKEIQESLGPEASFEGQLVLMAQALSLLVTFVGGRLALQLLHKTWPDISLEDLDLPTEGKQ